MKNFIKLILVFTLVFLSSMPVYATESTSLSMEDLDTVIYEEILTEFYGVEEGYAYCSVAVNITSDTALTEAVTIGIPDAVGTNVWRVSTELTRDSNVSAVQYNNSYYYLYPVLNPEFTDEGVSFQTDELGIFIAGGCFDNETLESFSSGTSNFNIDENNSTPSTRTEWVVEGVTYKAEDAIITDADTTQSFLGINYWIFEDGMCILDGVQTSNSDFNSTNEPWRLYNGQVNTVYDNHDCNGYKQNGMYEVYAYNPVVKKIIFGEDYNSTAVTSFQNMFYEYSGTTLKYVDMSNMSISNSVNDSKWNYDCVFFNCNNLNTIVTPRYNACTSIELPKTMYSYPDNTPYTSLPITTGESITLYDKSLPEDGAWLGASYALLDTDGDGVKETCYVYGTMTDTTGINGVEYVASQQNYKTYGFYSVLTEHPDVTKAIVNCSLGNRKSTESLFVSCSNLISLEFGTNFDTSNVTNMTYMFRGCRSLTSLDLRSFDTSNITYMSGMFYGCSKLTSLDLSSFDTSKVTSMSHMFSDCSSLTSLEFGVSFDTSNVTAMSYMFRNCKKLETLDLSNFDTSKVTLMQEMFYYCSSLVSFDLSNFNTENVKSMASMFYNCTSLTALDVSNFSTSNVTDMSYMFYNCNSLASLNVRNFNTSSVTNMNAMFRVCSSLVTLDVSNFNTTNVTNMSGMFDNCVSLVTLDVSNFDTSNVTKMYNMFRDCKSLVTLDVSNFDTANVTDMSEMFHDCKKLETLDLSNFDTTKVTDMYYMFCFCWSLTSLDISSFDTSKVTDMRGMFFDCTSLTSLDVSNFDTSNVTKMCDMFSECWLLTVLDVSNFDTANVTDMSEMFYDCKKLETLDLSNFDTTKVTDMSYIITGCWSLTTLCTPKTNTTEGINLPNKMYYHEGPNTEYTELPVTTGTSLTLYSFPKDGEWLGAPYYLRDDDGDGVKETCYVYGTMTDTTDLTNSGFSSDLHYTTHGFYSVLADNPDVTKAIIDCSLSERTSTAFMFHKCSGLDSITFGSNFNTSNITSMYRMFWECSSLTSLDVHIFDTSNVTNMDGVFYSCGKLISLDVSNFNTSNVTNMSYMFFECSSLTTLDLSNFNTINVTSMLDMFYGCSNLTSLNVSKFNTSNVKNIYGMFHGCTKLEVLDLSNFNTSNVTDMGNLFDYCKKLTSLDVSNFNTSKVTNMSSMFQNCSSLTILDVSNFNTSNVTNMSNMFNNCASLTTLEVSNFNTSNVTNMSSMFNYCNKLTSLDVSNFNTSNVTNISRMFFNCRKLTSLNLSNFDTSKVTDMSHMFDTCEELLTLNINNFDTSKVTNMQYMFCFCSKLTSLDISNFDMSSVTSIGAMLRCCSSLETLKTPHTNPVENIDLSKSMYTHPENTAYTSLPITTGTSLTLHDKEFKICAEGNEYNIADSLTSWDISLNEDGSVMAYLFDTDADSVGDTVILDGVGDTVGFNAEAKSDTTIYGDGLTSTVNDRGFGYKGSSNCYASPWTFPQYKNNIKHFYFTDSSNIVFGDAKYLFYNMSKLESIKFDKASFSNVTDMHKMFSGCSSLTSLDVSNFNTSNVTSMFGMFSGCSKLTSLDLSNFETSKVMYIGYMFDGCTSLTSLNLSSFDTTNVTSMSSMFYNCSSLASLDVSNFNTSNVTNMYGMFLGCSSLTSLNVSNFNTSNVTNISSIFNYCNKLTSLDVSNFNTSKITNMSHMFYNCQKLTSLEVSNFDTSKVTDMSHMFDSCTALTSLDVRNFNTSKVTNMQYMFCHLKKITSLDLRNFDTSNVTNMGGMFSNNFDLTSLDVSNFNTSNVTIMSSMLHGCSSLATLDLSSFDMSLVTNVTSMFSSCTPSKIMLPVSIGSTDVALNTTYYGYESDDSVPDSKVTYTKLVAKNPETGLTYLSTKEYPASESILRTCNNGTYFLNVENVSFTRNKIKSVNFVVNSDITADSSVSGAAYGPVDVSYGGKGALCAYSKVSSANANLYDIYIVAKFDRIYLNSDVDGGGNSLFKDLTQCSNLNGIEYLDTSRATCMSNMFKNFYSTYTKEVEMENKLFFHTSNLDDAGNGSNGYGSNLSSTYDVSIPNASSLSITITYQTQKKLLGSLTDYVCIYPYNVTPTSSNHSSSITGALYGTTKTTKTFKIEDNKAKIYFKSNRTSNNYYGFYAVVTGFSGEGDPITLDLSTFDTSNVTDMSNMFDGCGYYSEHEFDLSSFDMSSVTNCANMFSNNNKLKTLKTPETSNIENVELPHMFYGPTGLEYTTLPKTAGESIALTTTFTATLSNAHDLFGDIDAEGVLHITGTGSQLNTRLVDAIENVTLRNSITRISFDAGSIESIGDSWAKDTDIAGQLTLPNSVVTIGNDAFNDCKFTGALKLPNNLVTVGDRAFYSTSFTSIELDNKLTTIGADAFKYCDQLNTGSLIIPNSVTTIKSGAFSGITVNKFYVGKNVETLGTNVFDSSSACRTKLYTNSAVVKNYDWASGNRTIVPMNTFTVSIPEDITLTPKYVAGSAAPVWYASFDIVVTGEFDNGSYGSYEKLASFTIKSEDGETRTVTTNIENTTINQNGTTTFSVEIMSPNPMLLKDFTGELKLNTTLHEVIPFAA